MFFFLNKLLLLCEYYFLIKMFVFTTLLFVDTIGFFLFIFISLLVV